MGLIQTTVKNFENSLASAIGEEIEYEHKISNQDEVVYWLRGITTYDDVWHELNFAKSYSPDSAKIELIESMTSSPSATFCYYNGIGEYIEFYWDDKTDEFVRTS